MNCSEIGYYMKGFDTAFMNILDIIAKHINYVPPEMIKDLENYNKGKQYEAEAMVDGQDMMYGEIEND